MSSVAFLGLGAMGLPMAGRLVDAGHALRVWNRTPGRDEGLVAAGAERARTPAEAARDAEVVVTMLADPAALERVLFGSDGVAATVGPGATVVDMSTVGPTAIDDAATRLAPVAVLDAPVLGSVPHAESGTLTILVGGEHDVLGRCVDVLAVMGTVRHVGPSGAGAMIKARAMGLRLSVAEAAAARCDEAIRAGRADQDNTAIISDIRSGGAVAR